VPVDQLAIALLKQENFVPYWQHQIPGDDGGIAVGQIMAALRTHRILKSFVKKVR
jgi:hydrogenase maturation factor HypF (carbamoyltransferase family)